jgi:hypothetical protein
MGKKFHQPLHGRGAACNPDRRFQELEREWLDDGWDSLEQLPEKLQTTLEVDASRSIISSTVRLIPIVAVSTAVSTASPAPAMPGWGFRPDSISRPACSISPGRRSCCAGS